MKHIRHQQDIVAIPACTKIMMEATKGIGPKSIKGGTKDYYLFDSWFAFKKAAEAAMEVGAEFIGMEKKNTKRFCKDTIENLTIYAKLSGLFPVLSELLSPSERDTRKYWKQGFESEADKETYEWWRENLLINGFNAACKNIASSFMNVGDESMSEICFRTTEKGNLPHLSYVAFNISLDLMVNPSAETTIQELSYFS